MAAPAPVDIPFRPYSVAPPTNLMNPDGFFIVNMGPQWIETTVRNTSDSILQDVRVYVEGISDPGIARTPVIRAVGDVPPGAAVPVRFLADFSGASADTARVSFVVEADGFDFRRVLKKIFVTRVDYDKNTRTYSVVMPQGTMKVNVHKAIVGPGSRRCRDDRRPFVALPTDVTYAWHPTPPYEGVHGPFPYEDPWWKIALAILAALLLAGALLYDYFSDGSLDGGMVTVSGTFDETEPSVSCCTDIDTSATDTEDWVERGFYSSVGFAAMAAIASDDPDLHYRGQEATPPAEDEWTLREPVHLEVEYPEPPNLGRPYTIRGRWDYTRVTTGETYTHGDQDERKNEHWLADYEVEAPTVHDRLSGPLVVRARFQRPDERYYRGPELYVSCALVSTYGAAYWFEMKDHGMGVDEEANDAWYTGAQVLLARDIVLADRKIPKAEPGPWYLFVIAQDVNTVEEGTDPFEAAHTIGGFVLTSQLELNFDAPCTLAHDAVIQIV